MARPWRTFFFETVECRSRSGTGSRLARVGTHAVSSGYRTTLWNRLSQRRGVASTGGQSPARCFGCSSERRSCNAIPAVVPRGGPRPDAENDRVAERRLEGLVSRVIGEMPPLWLRVDDLAGRTSQRGYIERNAIALLSNHGCAALDPPSDLWLGFDCPKEAVRGSGLWNQRHVELAHNPEFPPVPERMVDEHIAWGGGT